MKYFLIIIFTLSSFGQTFDSPRDLLKDQKSSKTRYFFIPGLSFKYHNVLGSGLEYFEKDQNSNINASSLGINLRFDIKATKSRHGINLNANYGIMRYDLEGFPKLSNEILIQIPSRLEQNFLNLDLTYHYYLFSSNFSFFAGPGLFLFMNQNLKSENGDREFPINDNTSVEEINEDFDMSSQINLLIGAEYAFTLFNLRTSLSVIYNQGLGISENQPYLIDDTPILDLTNWQINDLQWRINVSYPFEL